MIDTKRNQAHNVGTTGYTVLSGLSVVRMIGLTQHTGQRCKSPDPFRITRARNEWGSGLFLRTSRKGNHAKRSFRSKA
jgi:hypothetical protein